MATRFLVKMQRDPKLCLQLLRNPTLILTRPISMIPTSNPLTSNESLQLSLNKAFSFPMILGMSQKPFAEVGNGGFSLAGSGTLFARQMGTGRSSTSKSRGGPSRDDEDDDDYDDDFDEGDIEDFDEGDADDFDEDMDDEDFDDTEEDENPKRKANRRN